MVSNAAVVESQKGVRPRLERPRLADHYLSQETAIGVKQTFKTPVAAHGAMPATQHHDPNLIVDRDK